MVNTMVNSDFQFTKNSLRKKLSKVTSDGGLHFCLNDVQGYRGLQKHMQQVNIV